MAKRFSGIIQVSFFIFKSPLSSLLLIRENDIVDVPKYLNVTNIEHNFISGGIENRNYGIRLITNGRYIFLKKKYQKMMSKIISIEFINI